MTTDLKQMLDIAAQILSPAMTFFGVVVGIGLAIGFYQSVRRAYLAADRSSDAGLRFRKQKKFLPDTDSDPEPPEKPKRTVAGIGDDGEMVFEDEEPRHMRRIE